MRKMLPEFLRTWPDGQVITYVALCSFDSARSETFGDVVLLPEPLRLDPETVMIMVIVNINCAW